MTVSMETYGTEDEKVVRAQVQIRQDIYPGAQRFLDVALSYQFDSVFLNIFDVDDGSRKEIEVSTEDFLAMAEYIGKGGLELD